jgi:hypothetical protein
VPDQAIETVCPDLLGTVTLCVAGVAAPPWSTPNAVTVVAASAITTRILRINPPLLGDITRPDRGRRRGSSPLSVVSSTLF